MEGKPVIRNKRFILISTMTSGHLIHIHSVLIQAVGPLHPSATTTAALGVDVAALKNIKLCFMDKEFF